MRARLFCPVLALLMLVPPGTCTCGAAERAADPATAPMVTNVEPGLRPVTDHCCGGHHEPALTPGPADHPDSPAQESPCSPSHDPSCPAVQQAVVSTIVRDDHPERTMPTADAGSAPGTAVPSPDLSAAAIPKRVGEPPPIFIRFCTLLI